MGVSREQVIKAARVLIAKQQHDVSVSNDLLVEEHQTLLLVIGLNCIEKNVSMKPVLIPLEHPIHAQDSVCVIVKDPQVQFETMLENTSLTGVEIMAISSIRKKYKTYERKRELWNAHDLFMSDERILHYLPKALGNVFFKRKKTPVSFRIASSEALEARVNQLRSGTTLYKSEGNCWVLKVAGTQMTPANVADNVMCALPKLIKCISGGMLSINNLQLKLQSSIALPIYQSVSVPPSEAEQKLAKERLVVKQKKRAAHEERAKKRKIVMEQQAKVSSAELEEEESSEEEPQDEAVPDFGLMLQRAKRKKKKKRLKL